VQTDGDSAGGGNANLTTTSNNSDTLIPPSLGSLDAPGSSSTRRNPLSAITDDGADKGGGNVEGSYVGTHEQGTPGQQPSAVPDLSMSTARPVPLSPRPAPPSSATSAERPRFTHALSSVVS